MAEPMCFRKFLGKVNRLYKYINQIMLSFLKGESEGNKKKRSHLRQKKTLKKKENMKKRVKRVNKKGETFGEKKIK